MDIRVRKLARLFITVMLFTFEVIVVSVDYMKYTVLDFVFVGGQLR
jgi:hypothetical protein